ncbi:GerMN domain-containing protein [Spongiactinospora sp. TRM90649]|uniref:AMIN-like domain-containing (lipo)protein n=1 Tax=Spongiactinospora sp. TRM90649 TaxID=3031114 RepID=UPI0023F99074|nr:GerMN domain-containing protein [Spongiactinospora sp. TRM90649]MDF5755239.1 GerMN domain-containing protein [Spongiactinospora sp. TRM90649]
MSAPRSLLALAVVGVTALQVVPTAALAKQTPPTPPTAVSQQTHPWRPTRLVDVRAAHRPGLDRIVFEFRGPLPTELSARYVGKLIADGSGRPVSLVGNAFLQVRLSPAQGIRTHQDAKQTYALPGVIQLARIGDFEGVVTYGVGLARRTPYRMYTLTHPNRVVIDIGTQYRTVNVRDYFLNMPRYRMGQRPYTTAVQRPAIPPATAYGALQRLFAGPTKAERTAGLRLVTSQATGFSKLTVRHGVARVYLTGDCDSRGSTYTVADQIFPTLKQFRSIRWVKIYDADGRTERPTGRTDSIPPSLEP